MITFRDAIEADLPEIVRLLANDALGQFREQVGPDALPTYARGFRAMVAQGGRIVLALNDGVIVGCLQLNILHGVSQLGQSRAQIEAVRVAAKHRNAGIGAALMRQAIAEATRQNCGIMQLTTNASRTAAQRFYARLGFVQSHLGYKLSLPTFLA